MNIGLCQPSTAILLISIAGTIYHAAVGDIRTMTWWVLVGLFGTGIFQALCFGNLEPVAWVLMFIPILVVCFFMAVALFASRMRIENIMSVPCDRCGNRHKHEDPCEHKENQKKPRCNKTRCDDCNGCGCSRCSSSASAEAEAE